MWQGCPNLRKPWESRQFQVTFPGAAAYFLMTTPDAESNPDLAIDELISLILGGRTKLYEEVIRRYQQDVLRVVSTLLYDRGPAEDLVQEVFVNAYFALPRFRPGCDFRPWIRTIARNAVREQLRKQSRYDRRLKTYREILGARLVEDQAAERREQALIESLQKCVSRLPEREAAAVRLRYNEGKTFEEIAAILGSSSGAIRNLLCRARASLREGVEREVNRQ